MALEQINNAITFYAFFSASGSGKTGLTVTVNVRRGTTSVVSGGSASELGDGLYYYTLASGSVTSEDEYTAVFKTTDTTVDQKDIPSLWVVGKAGIEHLDDDVTSRADAADYTSTRAGYLDTIYSKTLLITANNVSFTAPTDPITGDLTLVRGDDYTASSGRTLPQWSSADWSPFSLTTATSIIFKAKTRYDETIFEKAASALSDTQVQVELTSAETTALAVGHDAYDFDLEAALASGDVITLAQGQITVLEDVR